MNNLIVSERESGSWNKCQQCSALKMLDDAGFTGWKAGGKLYSSIAEATALFNYPPASPATGSPQSVMAPKIKNMYGVTVSTWDGITGAGLAAHAKAHIGWDMSIAIDAYHLAGAVKNAQNEWRHWGPGMGHQECFRVIDANSVYWFDPLDPQGTAGKIVRFDSPEWASIAASFEAMRVSPPVGNTILGLKNGALAVSITPDPVTGLRPGATALTPPVNYVVTNANGAHLRNDTNTNATLLSTLPLGGIFVACQFITGELANGSAKWLGSKDGLTWVNDSNLKLQPAPIPVDPPVTTTEKAIQARIDAAVAAAVASANATIAVLTKKLADIEAVIHA